MEAFLKCIVKTIAVKADFLVLYHAAEGINQRPSKQFDRLVTDRLLGLTNRLKSTSSMIHRGKWCTTSLKAQGLMGSRRITSIAANVGFLNSSSDP